MGVATLKAGKMEVVVEIFVDTEAGSEKIQAASGKFKVAAVDYHNRLVRLQEAR